MGFRTRFAELARIMREAKEIVRERFGALLAERKPAMVYSRSAVASEGAIEDPAVFAAKRKPECQGR